ncbi:MAG: Crp/Fnr family transcriptional regulator [Desulfobacteraceae bacterium]|jgi:CRP-like cAMP-binding protein
MSKGSDHLSKKIALFNQADMFKGISLDAQKDLAELAVRKQYAKNDIVFQSDEPCTAFEIVEKGLIRVSRYSALGKRLTYLLAGPGEPINLIGPFTGAAREYVAEAAQSSTIVSIERKDFTQFAFAHPRLVVNIIDILGHAVDSSNSRILDMLDKKVVDRLKRVLHTLLKKYGPTLNFTSAELAELVGTTTESALRVMADMREKGIIEKRRGQIDILKPEALTDPECDALWL